MRNKYKDFNHPRLYGLIFYLVAAGLGFGIVGVLGIPTAALSMIIADEFTLKGVLTAMKSPYIVVLQTLLNIVAYSLMMPIFYILWTLLYFDLKHKKEGYTEASVEETTES